jgi:drug/metabolite transporter (DMT)-like permease
MTANLYALAAIALWASLSALGVSLQHVPPFLLTGIALMIGSVLAWPFVLRDRRQWQVTPRILALGVFTLFGFHFLLFIALRMAPAVEVNLVNYLWPLFIVVLAPLYLAGVALRGVHIAAAVVGFAGAAIAILGGREGGAVAASTGSGLGGAALGYVLALGSAFIWANYSLQTKRMELKGKGFPTAAIGLFGLVSGALSLLCHWVLEPSVSLSARDWLLLAAMGLGPLGAAFFFWDKALKLGDARQIGVLSYLTPLASTVLLILVTGRALTWSIALAATMIIGAALVGTRRG